MHKTWGLKDRFEAMRRALVWAAQIGLFAISGVVAFLLRFDLRLPPAYRIFLAYALPIWILVKIVVFHAAKLDRGLWRYLSVGDLSRIAYGNLIASVVSFILIKVIAPQGFPRSIYVLDLIICFLATSGLRLILRLMLEVTSNARSTKGVEKSTLIYGAGDAGITLLREIRNNPRLPYRVWASWTTGRTRKACVLGAYRYSEEETRQNH